MGLEFTAKAKNALVLAEKVSKTLKQNYIGTEHILVGLLKEKTGVAATVLIDNGVEEKKLLELIKDLVAPSSPVALAEREGYSPRAKKILEDSEKAAERFQSKAIGTEHILVAIMKESDNVAARLLNTMGIGLQKLYMDLLVASGQDGAMYKEEMNPKSSKKKKKEGTATLDQYSRDITALAIEGKLDPIIGREAEIRRVIQILSRRTKNNPCLVGEPGVGKTAIAEGLAQLIVEGKVPDTVKNKRVVALDLSGMVAGSKYRGEFEERIKKVIHEVIEAKNVLLFLDEIHTLIGAGGAEGAIDASNILKPSLARGEIQLIGATTITEYRKYVEKDAALERRFQPVVIEETTVEQAISILFGIRKYYEDHHQVAISNEAIEAAVKLSTRYINDRRLPDKAIDLMDEASASVALKAMEIPEQMKIMAAQIQQKEIEMEQRFLQEEFQKAGLVVKEIESLTIKYEKAKEKLKKKMSQKLQIVTQDHVASIVADWTKIPVRKLTEKESERLLKLESILHKRVVGQENAVIAVSKAMRRGRVGLQDPNRPIGSFLFLGPTGVGKTELSKALAEAMFGSENTLIRVDMSEYMESHSVSKMIGSPPGYVGFDDGGQLSEKIRRNPYAVVLFDEIEKAHPDVFNLLLQVLDDGHITDSKGRKVSFKNAVLIMTSNAGAARIVDPKNLGFSTEVNEKKDYEKMKSGVMEEVKRLFKPEFINRIDEIIVFSSLNNNNMKDIVSILCQNVMNRCKKQMDILLTISPSLKDHIVTKYADKKMGARPLKRAIQNVIEDALAEEILLGNISQGDKVTVGYKNEKVFFTKK